MDVKPLSYENLKIVLTNMEANVRFQLSKCAPSVRKAEKLVPLKINKLVFNGMQMIVNRTEYKIGIYRKYHVPVVPRHIQKKNEAGGVTHDIDQYGVANYLADNILTPGDVVTKNSLNLLNEFVEMPDNQMIQQLEIKLQHNAFGNLNGDLIEKTRAKLLHYYHRRYQVLPPFQSFIQLTITWQGGKRVEHVKYNANLYEALKSLNGILFGNRSNVVNVKSLEIWFFAKVIRLPLGLKLKIRELHTWKNLPLLYEGFCQIIEDSSYPLNILEITGPTPNLPYMNHQIFRSAGKLILTCTMHYAQWLPVLLNLQNRNVRVKHDPNQLGDALVRNWLETGREIETCFTFVVNNEEIGRDFVQLIKERFHDKISGDRCVILPMSQRSDLKVSYEKDPEDPWKYHWILKMEVLPIGTAKLSV